MKTWVTVPVLALVLAGSARAQRPATPPPPPPPPPVPSSAPNFLFGPAPAAKTADTADQVDVVPEFFKDITLTAQQAAKIDSIRERYLIQYQVFTPGVRPDPATRQRVRALVRQELAEGRAVLIRSDAVD